MIRNIITEHLFDLPLISVHGAFLSLNTTAFGQGSVLGHRLQPSGEIRALLITLDFLIYLHVHILYEIIDYRLVGDDEAYLRAYKSRCEADNFPVCVLVSFLDLSRLTGGAALAGFWAIIFYKSLYTGLVAPPVFFALRRIFTPKVTPRI